MRVRRTGVGGISKVLAALMLGALAATAPGTAGAACQMITNAELNVRFVANQPLVEASINGKPVWMLIDTGAYTTLLFAPAAAALGLKGQATSDQVEGVGGVADLTRVRLDEFALQNVKVKGFEVNIGGGAHIGGRRSQDSERQVVGLLGRDFLALANLELDLANNKIRLLTFHDCGQRSHAYWTDAPGFVAMGRGSARFAPFFFPLKLNAYSVNAILDSGAGVTVVSPIAARHAEVYADQLSKETGKAFGVGARAVQTHSAVFNTVDLGDEKLSRVNLEISELAGADGSESEGLPMLLGADFLHAHRVLIAPDQDRIYFTYNGGPVFGRVSTNPDMPPAP